MTDKEVQAHEDVRWRNWLRAVTLYNQILSEPPFLELVNSQILKDRQMLCLLGRCECLLELGKYDQCVTDARKILTMLSEQQVDCLGSISRARRWLVHSLCKLKKYTEAEHVLGEWITELGSQPVFCDICKTLERYKAVIHMLSSNKTVQKITHSRLEEEMCLLDKKLEHWAANNLPLDKFSKPLRHKCAKKRLENQTIPQNNQQSLPSTEQQTALSPGSTVGGIIQKPPVDMLAAMKILSNKNCQSESPADTNNSTTCSYCTITFNNRNELRQHCQTEAHQNVIVSDEGRDWKWRPPPRGFTLDSYSLCETWSDSHSCHFGNQCVEAHGQDELNEWKERFEYRRMRVQKAYEKELYGKSYTEDVLERWIQSTAPEKIMCEKVAGIELRCEQDLITSISSKTSKREWIFILTSFDKHLKAVALLQDAYRNHFAIKSIKVTDSNEELQLKSNQEWVAPKKDLSPNKTKTTTEVLENFINNVNASPKAIKQIVTVEFQTEIYGTFRQSVCFDFGSEPLLVRHICVDVVPVKDAEKLEEIKRDIINCSATRWNVTNANLVKFETTLGTHLKTEAYLNDVKHEKDMLERYPCPHAQTFTLTQSTMEKHLTQNNYRSRIHELLYVEEIARYEQIARFNLSTKLTVTSNYILTPAGMATSTAKYSLTGELFGLMHLGKDISEDTSAGRLILSNCSSVYISPAEENHVKDKKRNVYEALIEDKGKNVIYLKLSAKCVEGMKLKADTEVNVDIQFQLNRLPYCEWHHAVDKMTDFKIIFPATEIEPNIPWTPKKQWSEACEPKLNAKQREAVNAITTSLSIKLPPILLIGPFGTGKTYTLAQAIKQLLNQPEAKILICTHSNSAADLYIKEYLHPWIEEGLKEAVPLRVYYHKRWVATVNSVVQKYCVTDGAGNFRRPSVEDIMKHRIVVVTLNISMELANLDIPKGYFTHIFLDEAAQAMECEAIMPLALANDSTRIVLAGDHMQMSPELFSAFAKERKLHMSLLERLYGHYPSNFPCKILLCENYRAHDAIIKFTSELFYEQKLIASGKQPRHEKFYPLTFFTTRGEDVQDKNSTAFYNNAEVYEVVERVLELRKKWPSSWGKINDASIGIMTPYADQVFRIRSELRKRRMGGISVERVLNVQGKQFRAVFLSTVRTRRTCLPNAAAMVASGSSGQSLNSIDDTDYGFLSNSKLLNTAITRAQSLVAVVGDPVALCSIGRCRKVWERFIEICHENKSLFGITMWQLRSQLDGVELRRGYVLNPLAPEFIPRSLQPEAYLRDQAAMYLAMAGITSHHHHSTVSHGGPLPQSFGSHSALLNSGSVGMAPIASSQHSVNMPNQLMSPHIYGPHTSVAPYTVGTMMNQGIAGNKAIHSFPNHPTHIQMRAIGSPLQSPQQQLAHATGPPPMGGQPYNPRGPPPQLPSIHMGQLSTSPYMNWHGTQPPMRVGPPVAGAPYTTPLSNQQPGMPAPQNPNATLWGPPPQSNPWSSLPKSQMPQPPSNINASCNSRPMPTPQQVPNQNIRANNVILQPSTTLNTPQQMRSNSSDMNYLTNKSSFGNSPIAKHQPALQQQQPTHLNFTNFGCNVPSPQQIQMMNQRNLVGIPNGPLSPMDTFLQRPSTGTASNSTSIGVTQNPFFCQSTSVPTALKENDYQLLNNVHLPPLNTGMNMFSFPGNNNAGNIISTNFAGANNKQQSPASLRFPQPHEYTSILPPNISIYEMAFESKDVQYKWYLKLLESQGQEAASKFTELLRQVTSAVQQQQQPNIKSNQSNTFSGPPQTQTHLTAMPSQITQRDLMQPIINYSTPLQQHQPPQTKPQQQQHIQSQQRLLPPCLGSGSTMQPFNLVHSSVSAPRTTSTTMIGNEDPSSMDVNINFNQQIDMVFNSIINGNEISQPILRDLFDISSVTNLENNNHATNNPKTDLKGDNVVNVTPPPQHTSNLLPNAVQSANLSTLEKNPLAPPNLFTMPYVQRQQQAPQFATFNTTSGFVGNNSLLDNKEFLLVSNMGNTTPTNSVPLYRRQGINAENGQKLYNGVGNPPNSSSNGSRLSSSTPDNILNCGTVDILTGIGTGTAGNLIEALFQNKTQQEMQIQKHGLPNNGSNSNNNQKLYNTYNNAGAVDIKQHDLDLFVGNNNTFLTLMPNSNMFHAQGQQAMYSHNNTLSQQLIETSRANNTDTRGTTYAAVLSQGPQQQADIIQHNISSSNCMANNFNGSHNFSGLNIRNSSTTSTVSAANNGQTIEKDAFAGIRELGQGTNGLYNYFQ